jgi:hypothetical protein
MTHALNLPPGTCAVPAAHDWVLDPDQVQPQRRPTVPRYGDDRWSLLALSQNPSTREGIVYWKKWFPDAYRDAFRHAAWALITLPLPRTVPLVHGGAPMRVRLSADRTFKTIQQWAVFAHWLVARGIPTLSAVTADDLTAFAGHLDKQRGMARNTACGHLITLTRLHFYGTAFLPAVNRLTEPPWLRDGHDDYLPAASSRGENLTEPITPQTMGPLLVWSLRFLEQFADDILNAYQEREQIMVAAAAADSATAAMGNDQLLRYLYATKQAGGPIPVIFAGGLPARAAIIYLAAKTGTPTRTVAATLKQPIWREYLRRHHASATLDTPVTGRLDGRPWHEPFPYYERHNLVRMLSTACFVVIAYLTGMRPGEVLALEVGCCPQPPAAGSGRQLIYATALEEAAPGEDAPAHALIHGRQFKHAVDENGVHQSAGAVRVPWVAVPPVVTAVRVMERLSQGSRLLFDAMAEDRRSSDIRTGRSLSPVTVHNRVKAFIEWVNQHARSGGREAEVIPADAHGAISLGRFRRTLAWHIARRPGGLVALAVQYGHLRTLISEGYAARSRNGIHELLDFETARAVAQDLTDVHEALDNGGGVSGPAARRLINAAGIEHRRFGGLVTTTRQARSLLADPTLNVFHNSEAFLFCNYDRAKALCHPSRGGQTTPSLDRCRSNCANIARTDEHASQIENAAGELRAQACSPLLPKPLADRLRQKADHLAQLASDHRASRITADQEDS